LEGPSDEAQPTLGPDPSRGPPAHRRTAGPGRSLIPQPGGSTSRGRNGGARRSLTAGGGGSPRIEAGARLPGPFVSPPRIAGGIPPRGPRDGARRLPVRGPIRGERRDRSRRGRGPGDSRGFGATGAARADLFSTVFPGTVCAGLPYFRGRFTVFPGTVRGRKCPDHQKVTPRRRIPRALALGRSRSAWRPAPHSRSCRRIPSLTEERFLLPIDAWTLPCGSDCCRKTTKRPSSWP